MSLDSKRFSHPYGGITMTAAQNIYTDPDFNAALQQALGFLSTLGPQRVITMIHWQSTLQYGNTTDSFMVVYWTD